MNWYSVNYHGGGTDVVCANCRAEAKREALSRATLVSIARVHPGGEDCAYCGRPSS